MSYTQLTAVYFRHHYFATTRYEQLQVLIPAATAIDMRRYGLLLRQLPDGITLSFDDALFSRQDILRDALPLKFDLSLKDYLFYNYTDLQQDNLRESMLLFSNQQNSVGRLHQDTYVSVSEVAPLSGSCFVRPFGRIELLLDEKLEQRYEICFAPRATHWYYFLMSGHLQEINNPAVLDPEGIITFTGPQPVILPDSRQVPVFVSDTPVPLSQQQRPFMLVDLSENKESYRTVIPILAMPDISRISVGSGSHTFAAEIFLY